MYGPFAPGHKKSVSQFPRYVHIDIALRGLTYKGLRCRHTMPLVHAARYLDQPVGTRLQSQE